MSDSIESILSSGSVEAIRLVLNNPPPTDKPFFGKIEDVVDLITNVIHTRQYPAITKNDNLTTKQVKLRVLAFFIVESGITYTELGASIPIPQVTIVEHLELKKIHSDITNKMMRHKR